MFSRHLSHIMQKEYMFLTIISRTFYNILFWAILGYCGLLFFRS